MSLIETMILIAVVTVGILGVFELIDQQRRQKDSLTDKLASLDVQRTLTSVLDSSNVCTAMLTDPAQPAFNPTAIASINPQFNNIPSRAVAGATAAVVADNATPASPLSARLTVSSIQLKDLDCAISPCAPDSTQFTGTLEIQFSGSRGHSIAWPHQPKSLN